MKTILFAILLLSSGSIAVAQSNDKAKEVFAEADIPAEFPGGINKFYRYVANNFIFPDTVEEIDVKVYVSVVVDVDGSLDDIIVVKDPGHGLAEEAVRVLKASPAWMPATKGGKAVRSPMMLPIKLSVKASPVEEDTEIYRNDLLDSHPEFPGGVYAFYQLVADKLNLPKLDKDIDVKVYINFVVEKDGTMTNIKAAIDPGYGIGREAESALMRIKKKWKPGILSGNPVRVSHSLPITVKIRGEKRLGE